MEGGSDLYSGYEFALPSIMIRQFWHFISELQNAFFILKDKEARSESQRGPCHYYTQNL
jgi:hypothetical protein